MRRIYTPSRKLFKIAVFTFIQGLLEICGQTLGAYSIHRSDETMLHEREFGNASFSKYKSCDIYNKLCWTRFVMLPIKFTRPEHSSTTILLLQRFTNFTLDRV